MSQQFQSLIENRRTIYHIGKNVQLSTQDLTHLIENAIEHAPSAFNSQTSRAVILFHAEHEAFWTLAFDQLKQFLPDDEAKERTQAKLNSFSAGIATILFFEDTDVVKGLQTQSHYMPTISLFGQNIRQVLHNLQFGRHLQSKV